MIPLPPSLNQMLVLEVISELCRDPLALVEMFVNYDCDLQAIDLFKRIVTALAKVRTFLSNVQTFDRRFYIGWGSGGWRMKLNNGHGQ